MRHVSVRFEPAEAASEQLAAFARSQARSKQAAIAKPLTAFEEAYAEYASERIERVAEIIELLETYAIAEVELVDSEYELEDVGFVAYELSLDLEVAEHEVTPEPDAVFVWLFELFSLANDSGLYVAEVVADGDEVSLASLLSVVAGMAREAGFEVDPESAPKTERKKADGDALSKAELFFIAEAGIEWPSDGVVLKRAWKALAARFHPDVNRDVFAVQKFHLAREGYERLTARQK